ncbi:hypothetical protein EVAR_36158_1 [Eumeta japonica]|uniref:Uncharacterized protein n=1 Tax=Eumeta variegata TaxID=151549 RepID=A0A4C1X191_EUMVA|nr:hypothetical protein EVAR_36158_1 [Eumeta japonica]
MRDVLLRRRPKITSVLYGSAVSDKLRHRIETLVHATHSPDVVTWDFCLSSKIKGKLRGKWFTIAEEAVVAFEKAVDATPKCEWAMGLILNRYEGIGLELVRIVAFKPEMVRKQRCSGPKLARRVNAGRAVPFTSTGANVWIAPDKMCRGAGAALSGARGAASVFPPRVRAPRCRLRTLREYRRAAKYLRSQSAPTSPRGPPPPRAAGRSAGAVGGGAGSVIARRAIFARDAR